MKSVISITELDNSTLHQEVHELVKTYIRDCKDMDRNPCKHILWELFGKNAHMAEDEVYYLRDFIQDLFAFLATPEINKLFAEQTNAHTAKFPQILRSLTAFAYQMNNPLALAEIADAHLENYHMDTKRLQYMKNEYTQLLQETEIKKAA